MKRFTARLLLLLLLPLFAHAEMNFITLNHRNAETLIPLLQPALDPDIGISGRGPTLIVNSKPWQLEEIRTLIEQLDTPLQSLIIHVIQGGDDNRATMHGDVTGTLSDPKIRLYGTRKKENAAVSQQLRVIEGEWATISAGESIPLVKQSTRHTPHGSTTHQSIEYKNIQSGFEVRPRIHGERVTLEVRPFRAKRSHNGSGIIEQQSMITTVSGSIGEWITIGGVTEQQQHSGTGTVYATARKRSATHNVKLKVERPPN